MLSGWLNDSTLKAMRESGYARHQLRRYSAWNCMKTKLFSGHYLCNCSTLDIGVCVISLYFNLRNTLPKFHTFLLRHLVYVILDFGKRLSWKSDKVVVFPFAFHIAVQQPFKPLWSRLLLNELKPSRTSFAMCFKSLQMTLLPASILISLFV